MKHISDALIPFSLKKAQTNRCHLFLVSGEKLRDLEVSSLELAAAIRSAQVEINRLGMLE
jgi:hypothetical protein